MSRLKCHACGKYISDKDYQSGKLKSQDIWNWDKTELEDQVYFCVKCSTDKSNEGE